MLIPYTILFQSDHFWESASLGVLRMLVMTCKEFRVELRDKALLDHALLTLTRHEPTLNLTEAKYRFSLKLDAMVRHCAMLPSEDTLHISEEELKDIKFNYHRFHIRFIDAYYMACKNGLKAAMDRRHRFETKIMDSGRKTAEALHGRLLPLMRNTREAQTELKKNLAALRKDSVGKKRVPGENELHKGIRLLKRLQTDLAVANFMVTDVRDQSTSARPNIQRIGGYVADLKILKKTLVARYRAHAVYCPALLTTDCLEGIE